MSTIRSLPTLGPDLQARSIVPDRIVSVHASVAPPERPAPTLCPRGETMSALEILS